MFQAKLTPTAAGRALLAKAQQGAAMEFTGVRIGSGTLGSRDPDALINVITAVKTCPIISVSRQGEKTYVKFVLTQDNTSVYYLREMALMAKDPDSGEIAYMYANDGDNAELIQVPGATAFEREITVIVILSNVENVTATIQSGAYAGKEEFDAHVNDKVCHIAEAEREKWNKKVGLGTDGKIPSTYLPEQKNPPLEDLDGTLSVGKGGTGRKLWSQNRILYASETDVLGQLAFPGTDGSILRQNKSGAPYWSTPEELVDVMSSARSAHGTYTGDGTGRPDESLSTFIKNARKIELPFAPIIIVLDGMGDNPSGSNVLKQKGYCTYGYITTTGRTEYYAQYLEGNILYVGASGTYGANVVGVEYSWAAVK